MSDETLEIEMMVNRIIYYPKNIDAEKYKQKIFVQLDALDNRITDLESENKALKLIIANSHSMSELRRLREQIVWRRGDTLKNEDDTQLKCSTTMEAKNE